MADTIDQLVFTDNLNVLTPLLGSGLVTLDGTLQIDYTTNTVTGSLTTGALGGPAGPLLGLQTYSSWTLTPNDPAAGTYTLTSQNTLTGLTITFGGETPTSNTASIVALPTAPLVGGLSLLNTTNGSVAATPVCFAAGTLIRTPKGEIPIEQLRVGGLVMTASGEEKPIKWLGHRTIDFRNHSNPRAARPIRISTHAFGKDRPARNLFVSPGHSICVDILGEVLIPASRLINGATIAQVEVEEVTYWHVELESHDILLAENLPAESYHDVGNRGFFAESGVVALDAVPDDPASLQVDTCRPLYKDGLIVDTVRHRLRAQAQALGWRIVEDPLADLHLIADGRRIEPDVEGFSVRFAVPASVRELWLVSKASVPRDIGHNNDSRLLGVRVSGLWIDDGLAPRRVISLGDPRLSTGFHRVEEGVKSKRWTNGRALLPQDLWAGCRGLFFLRVDLGGPAVPRWVAPDAADCGIEPFDGRLFEHVSLERQGLLSAVL